jgi:hypothetical protein
MKPPPRSTTCSASPVGRPRGGLEVGRHFGLLLVLGGYGAAHVVDASKESKQISSRLRPEEGGLVGLVGLAGLA